MPRYISTKKRTEEEKRNLKVDLKRIPEWEAETESIRAHFRRFSLPQISSAASLIQEMREKLHLFRHSWDREQEQQKLDRWKNSLTVDSLIRLSNDYSAPDYLRSGTGEDIVENIRSTLKETERYIAECRAKGVTDSFWISMFTSKVDIDTLRRIEQRKAEYIAYASEISRIEDALRLFSEARSESRKYAIRMSQIEERLALAKEKRGAIERFEAKHGKVFAKAAAIDNQTRSRATSLKRLVKKTKHCPYCGGDLGSDPHLDHIYPVSKGGLSIVENLVWCCSACNVVKADKGLMQFLKERDLSIEQTLSQLHSLGKHV